MCCFRVCDGQRYVILWFVLVRDVLFQCLCMLELCCFRVCDGQRCVVSGFVMVGDVFLLGL